MTMYAVMKMDAGRFQKGRAYQVTDHDDGSYELGGDDEWVDRSQFIRVSSKDVRLIIARHFI